MRLTLIDVLVFSMFYFLSMVVSAGLVVLGWGEVFQNLLFVFPTFLLVGGSYLYKRAGFLPILLPRCPHCDKHGSFHRADFVMDRLTLLCGDCGGPFNCWFSKPPQEYELGSCPELLSSFPQIFGSYQILGLGEPPKEVGSACPEEIFRMLVVHRSIGDKKSLAERLEKQDVCREILPKVFGPPSGYSPSGDFLRVYAGENAFLVVAEKSGNRETNLHNLWRATRLIEWASKNEPDSVVYDVGEECVEFEWV